MSPRSDEFLGVSGSPPGNAPSTAKHVSSTTGTRRPWRLRYAYIALFVGVTALHLASVNRYWRFQRDSAVYMSLGRSLAEGRGYVENYRPHTIYPPGFPAILALLDLVFGAPERISDEFLPMNLAVTILGLASIAFFALFLREEAQLPDNLAFVALLFWATSRTLYYYSAHIMSDVPYTAFAMATLWCGARMLRAGTRASWAWCAFAGVLGVAASAIRPVGPVLTAALVGSLWLRHGAVRSWRGNLGKSLLLLALILLPIAAWYFALNKAAPYFEKGPYRGHLYPRTLIAKALTALPRLPRSADGLADAMLGAHLSPVTGFLLGGIALVGLVGALRRGERILSLYGLLNVCVIVAGGWALGRRYLLPALPALYFWLVMGGRDILEGAQRRGWVTTALVRRIAIIATVLIVGTNLGRIARIVVECRSPRFYEIIEDGRLADYAAVTDWLRTQTHDSHSVMCVENSTVHYFSRWRTVITPLETRKDATQVLLNRIARNRVRYILLDDDKKEGTPLVERLRAERPDCLRTVMKCGRVEVIEVVDVPGV